MSGVNMLWKDLQSAMDLGIRGSRGAITKLLSDLTWFGCNLRSKFDSFIKVFWPSTILAKLLLQNKGVKFIKRFATLLIHFNLNSMKKRITVIECLILILNLVKVAFCSKKFRFELFQLWSTSQKPKEVLLINCQKNMRSPISMVIKVCEPHLEKLIPLVKWTRTTDSLASSSSRQNFKRHWK